MATYTTLIDAPTLALHIDDPRWLVVDTRFDLAQPAAGEDAYAYSHIRGAIYVHLDRDLAQHGPGAMTGGRHPMPSRETVRTRFAQLGIGDGTQVVVYDAAGGMYAARCWWMLRWIGHPDVAVLDGGWPEWLRRDLPVESQKQQRSPATLTLRTGVSRLATVDDVRANITARKATLLDARAPDRYDGSNENIDAIGGHIPGAVNAFFRDSLDAEGRFRAAPELRARFDGITHGKPAIHQCGSGVTACHNALAMAHAGLPEGALYAGSWSEWIEDRSRPITSGR